MQIQLPAQQNKWHSACNLRNRDVGGHRGLTKYSFPQTRSSAAFSITRGIRKAYHPGRDSMLNPAHASRLDPCNRDRFRNTDALQQLTVSHVTAFMNCRPATRGGMAAI